LSKPSGYTSNVRLDMAVDGPANRVYEVNPVALPEGPGNPAGNAWRAEEVLIESEAAGARSADPLGGRYWKVINDKVPNALGHPPGYKLVPDHAIAAFCHPGSAVARRAGFITRAGSSRATRPWTTRLPHTAITDYSALFL